MGERLTVDMRHRRDSERFWLVPMFEKPFSLETNPDTISRVVVGSKGTMPSDAGMKPPKRT
ncbi:MAG: hypothetical protein QOI43_3166 [Gaiellales bacterium]|jgi:hypothetical protein|nr:hypothetical protein [Gaiellales bacterium]